jgi:hypothetical protein
VLDINLALIPNPTPFKQFLVDLLGTAAGTAAYNNAGWGILVALTIGIGVIVVLTLLSS